VSNEATVASASASESFVAQLARFFPDVTPLRIPVRISGVNPGGCTFSESTVIEFGTPNEVLFASALPLEFEDKLRVENADGSLRTEASVVAVQYHNGRLAVAARFARRVANWIVQR
jgi:hypothetical protein